MNAMPSPNFFLSVNPGSAEPGYELPLQTI